MASQRNRRIAKELADLQADTHSKITVQPAGSLDDLTHLKGSFKGPDGTPYEGGTYVIDIRLNSEYPFKAPKMTFDTKIWHPNVSSQTVCLLFLPFTSSHSFSLLLFYQWRSFADCVLPREPSASTPSPPPGPPSSPSNPLFSHSNLFSTSLSPMTHKTPKSPT